MIQWFPGHMKKTHEMLIQQIHKADLIIEVLDARAPRVKNPLLEEITKTKKKIILLNKRDLAEKESAFLWQQFYQKEFQTTSLLINASENSFHKELYKETKKMFRREKWFQKRSIQTLIIGVPNTGKSTIINSLLGKKKAAVGNRPGITRSKQWLKNNDIFNFLDTPGILWHKIVDPDIGYQLAIIGCIKDELLKKKEICFQLLFFLLTYYREQTLFFFSKTKNKFLF